MKTKDLFQLVSLFYEKGKSTLRRITINICIKTGKLIVSGVIEKTQFSLTFDNPAVNNLKINNQQLCIIQSVGVSVTP